MLRPLPFPHAEQLVRVYEAFDEPDTRANTTSARARLVPTIIFHGDQDATVSVRNGESIIADVLKSYGEEPAILRTSEGEANGRRYTRAVYADEAHRDFLETWIIHDGAHLWSGGSADGSYTDASGPDASAEMVRFFTSH